MELQDIKNFVEGNLNYFSKGSLPQHILEQVQLRMYMCEPCLKNGKCLKCGCKTPHMFYSPSKKDADNKWGEFLNEFQWNALKSNYEAYYHYFDAQQRIQRSVSGTEELPSVSSTDAEASSTGQSPEPERASNDTNTGTSN